MLIPGVTMRWTTNTGRGASEDLLLVSPSPSGFWAAAMPALWRAVTGVWGGRSLPSGPAPAGSHCYRSITGQNTDVLVELLSTQHNIKSIHTQSIDLFNSQIKYY